MKMKTVVREEAYFLEVEFEGGHEVDRFQATFGGSPSLDLVRESLTQYSGGTSERFYGAIGKRIIDIEGMDIPERKKEVFYRFIDESIERHEKVREQ